MKNVNIQSSPSHTTAHKAELIPRYQFSLSDIIWEATRIVLCACFHWYSLCLTTEGWPSWVDKNSWLHIKMVNPCTDSRLSKYWYGFVLSNFVDQTQAITTMHDSFSETKTLPIST